MYRYGREFPERYDEPVRSGRSLRRALASYFFCLAMTLSAILL